MCGVLIAIVLAGCGADDTITDQPKTSQTEANDNAPLRVITWEKDNAVMVLVPAGTFKMGDPFAEGKTDELPVHEVTLDAFYMDRYEVTIGQYKQFLSETDHGTLPPQIPDWLAERAERADAVVDRRGQLGVGFTPPTDKHPVVGITFSDAQAYAEWAGKRLPTEAEWEYAARGGLTGKRYTWGNRAPEAADCNFSGVNPSQRAEDGYSYTAPVGKYPANGYGLRDMAGNAWEWCSDWYSENYYSSSAPENPKGPEIGTERVLRGGGWSSYPANLRLARRLKLEPTAPGFSPIVEFAELENRQRPPQGQRPPRGQGPPQGQGPPWLNADAERPEPGQQRNPNLSNSIGVGFRCVAELTGK